VPSPSPPARARSSKRGADRRRSGAPLRKVPEQRLEQAHPPGPRPLASPCICRTRGLLAPASRTSGYRTRCVG
jgi:hypothetical protein